MRTEFQRAAFTLTELLVTSAILIMLLAIAFPVFRRVREQFQAVKCQGNLRQAGISLRTYANEHRGIILFQRYDYYGNPSTMRWNDFLIQKNYIRPDDPLQWCPALSPSLTRGGGYVYGGIGFANPNDPFSYTFENLRDSRIIRLHTIDEPARYWLLSDTWSNQHQNQIYIVANTPQGRWRIHMRHSGKANVLFADGHVEAMDLAEMKKLPHNPITDAFDAQGRSLQ